MPGTTPKGQTPQSNKQKIAQGVLNAIPTIPENTLNKAAEIGAKQGADKMNAYLKSQGYNIEFSFSR